MPTFKTVIHPPYKRADGTFRVKIRITHNKQSRYLPTPYYASAAEVNDKLIEIINECLYDKELLKNNARVIADINPTNMM